MPSLGPTGRADLIRYLRQLGFEGPYAGRTHEFMIGRGTRVKIPNPHGAPISVHLLSRLLRQAGITRDEWEAL